MASYIHKRNNSNLSIFELICWPGYFNGIISDVSNRWFCNLYYKNGKITWPNSRFSPHSCYNHTVFHPTCKIFYNIMWYAYSYCFFVNFACFFYKHLLTKLSCIKLSIHDFNVQTISLLTVTVYESAPGMLSHVRSTLGSPPRSGIICRFLGFRKSPKNY